MILASMALAERNEEFAEVAQRLFQVCRSGRIAGGYARDTIFGADASDIDFWIPIRYYPERERRLHLVEELGDALGQYNFRRAGQRLTTSEELTHINTPFGLQVSEESRYPTAAEGNPTGIVEAYEAADPAFINRGHFNKLQVIFVDRGVSEIENSFHVGLCRVSGIRLSGTSFFAPYASPRAEQDWREHTLTINTFAGQRPDKVVSYLEKLKRKFPGFNVNITVPVTDLSFHEYYTAMFEGGLLNAPRAILQAETQGTAGDTIRQQDRASTASATGGTSASSILGGRRSGYVTEALQRLAQAEAQRIRAHNWVIDDLGVPQRTVAVSNAAGVQPGLQGGAGIQVFHWDEPTAIR